MSKLTRYQQVLLLSFTLFLLMILVAVFHEDGILNVYKYRDAQGRLRASNEALKKENIQIKDEIMALKSSPLAVEKIAREKLQLVKPGETVYQIVRPKKSFSPSP